LKNFLIIDDHVIVRSGMKLLLSEIYKSADIHEAFDGDTATQKLKENTFDLIMMDIQMPKTDTFGLMEYIHVKYPEAKVLIFSVNAENTYAKRFMKAGAYGFVSKESPLEEIIKAINLVLNDRKYISETLAYKIAEDSIAGRTDNPFNKLSPREFEIVTLLLNGKTGSDISQILNIQVSTVGTHKARLFEKLNVTNILELKELATVYKV
jgi:two-component system, NarL family, invasion response regulator UvrY